MQGRKLTFVYHGTNFGILEMMSCCLYQLIIVKLVGYLTNADIVLVHRLVS